MGEEPEVDEIYYGEYRKYWKCNCGKYWRVDNRHVDERSKNDVCKNCGRNALSWKEVTARRVSQYTYEYKHTIFGNKKRVNVICDVTFQHKPDYPDEKGTN